MADTCRLSRPLPRLPSSTVSSFIPGDRLEGLYTAPEFAGQGIGAGLLAMLEGLMRDWQFPAVRAEASLNARDFYLRRGYRADRPANA